MHQLQDKALKSYMDAPYLSHVKVTEEHVKANNGKPVLGHSKYQLIAAGTNDFPELIIAEDLILGFLKGSSFGGNVECEGSLNNLVYYGFEVVNNREVYNPAKLMKATIAIQKLTEQQAIFYA